MTNLVELNPELVRLAQLRNRDAGASLELEVARAIAEETVLELDPDLGFIIDGDAALSSSDLLSGAIGANDLVINDKHLDVRVLDSDGCVSISRVLVGTSYLALGSLVVKLDNNHSGAVVAYIGPGAWLSAEQHFARERCVQLSVDVPVEFDLASELTALCNRITVHAPVPNKSLPDSQELNTFFANSEKIIVARQKQIVAALVCNQVTRELLVSIEPEVLKQYRSAKGALSDASVWHARVDLFAGKVAPTFPSLTLDEVRNAVRKTGEFYGGQPEAPAFRRNVLSTLTREQLLRKFKDVPAAKVMGVIDQVLAGRSAFDSVKELMNNKIAVDLAASIKRGRDRVEGFVAASADEIGAAFQQLALQPAYATHSANSESGVEAINEALQLLEAGDLAEQSLQLEQELAES